MATEGISKIVLMIVVIVLILVFAVMARGFIERGVGIAGKILGKSGQTAEQSLDQMNKDMILSMTKFTVIVKSGNKIVDQTQILGYDSLQSYLAEYNIPITNIKQSNNVGINPGNPNGGLGGNGNSGGLTPDVILKAYQSKCGGGGNNQNPLQPGQPGQQGQIGQGQSGDLVFSGSSSDGQYTVTIIVTLPDCSNS